MSGSGGTIYDPEPPPLRCERLTFKTVLNSPNPGVIHGLAAGDELDLTVSKRNGFDVVEAVYQGDVAGSITSDLVPKLVDCASEGFVYVADVLSINGGRVEVEVHVKAGS